jgi:hypothetical protein
VRRLADFVVAAGRVHHDPAGLAPVLGRFPFSPGQAQAQPLGDHERQHRAGQHRHPEEPGHGVQR